MIFVPDPDAVLLIQRAERVGDRWSGQMAFPGGRRSPDDADLLATARRETHEEVGVDLGGATLLGRLDDLAPRTPVLPPIIVSPFVFALSARTPFALSDEVAAASWVPVDRLIDPVTYRPYDPGLGLEVAFSGYHLDEGVVWGMTERILTPLLSLLGTH